MCARATDEQEGRSAQSESVDKSLREPEANRYEFVQELDEGSYGCVFACVQRPSGRLVAVKVCKHTEDPVVRRLLLREVGVLRSLPRHPCVVELLDAFRSRSSGRPHLVFECMERSAQQELEALDETRMCPVQLKLVAWQAVMGLAHCHRNNVIHRDLKPGNILLAGKGAACNAKLCDFGFARNMLSGRPDMQERLSSYVVTRWYRAPEILVGDKYGMASDVWALGCTLAELSNGGLPLLPGTSSLDQLARIMRCCGPLPPCQALCLHANRRLTLLRKPPPRSRTVAERLPGVDPALVALVTACLQTDPALRPTARRLLAHPYFADVPRLLRGSPLQAELVTAAAELQLLATPLGPQMAPPIPAGVAGVRQTTSQQLRELQQWATQRRLLAVTATAAAEAAAAASGGGAGAAAYLAATGVAAPAASHAATSASGPSSDETGAARSATEATPSPVAMAPSGGAAAVSLPPVPPQGVVARARPFIAQAVSGGGLEAAVSTSLATAAAAETEASAARATGPGGTTTASPWTSAATASTASAAAAPGAPPAASPSSAATAAPTSAAAASQARGAGVPGADPASRAAAALAAAPGTGAAAAGNSPYARVSGEPAWAVPSRSEGVMRLQTQNSTAVNADSVAVNALSAPLACHGGGSSSSADDGAEVEPPRSSGAAADACAAAAAAEGDEAGCGMQVAAASSDEGSDSDDGGEGCDDRDGGTMADEEDVDTPTAAAPAAGQARNALRRRAAVTGFLLDSGFGGNGGSGSNGSRRVGGTIPVFAVSSSSLAPAGDAVGARPGSSAGGGLVCAVPGAASSRAAAATIPAPAGRAAGATTGPTATAGASEGSSAAPTVAATAAAAAAQQASAAAAAVITSQQSPVLPAGGGGGGLFGTLCSTSSVLLAQLLGTNSPLPGSAAAAAPAPAAAGGGAAAARATPSTAPAAVVPSTPVWAPPSSPRRNGTRDTREHNDDTAAAPAPILVLAQHQLQAHPHRDGTGADAEQPPPEQQHMHMLAQHRSMCKRFASRSLCHVDCPPPPVEHAAALAAAAAAAAAAAVTAAVANAGGASSAAGPDLSHSVPLPTAAPLTGAAAAGPPGAARAGYAPGRALSSSGAPAGSALSSTTFGGDGGLLLLPPQEQRPPMSQQQLDVERPSPAGLPAAMREAVMLQEQARRMRQQQQQHHHQHQHDPQMQQTWMQHQHQHAALQQRGQGQQQRQAGDAYGWSFVAPQPQAAAVAHKQQQQQQQQQQQHVFPLPDGARYYAALSAVAAHATGAATGSAASAAATAAAATAATRLPHERAPTPAWFDAGSVSTTGGRSSCGISNTAIAAVAAAAVAATAAVPARPDFGGAATPDFASAVPMAPSALEIVDGDGDGAASGRAVDVSGAAVSGHEWAAVGTFADGLATQADGLPHVVVMEAAVMVSADDDSALAAAAGGVGGATKPRHQQGSLAVAEAGSGAPGAVRCAEKKGRRLSERVAAVLGSCFGGPRQTPAARAL
ncbi:hypothetical protein HYH02_007337 [Chlamydomonas schloesseri]|uniref:cyclin-dependent kinase n=1 Tax=Chlamydomonas schloesseri TaxID=2026947 RepID=A0A835WI69_9CHLO|nr:hypothetical protein HYH02_007337 [Chlamydomonas schloesseri]|eukprot:KAG2447881.1 hypothetical protein HYH02_007337 [Chlamydomonas schloesseri]